MDNTGQGSANNFYRSGGFNARGGQRGHSGGYRGGQRGGYRGGNRGGFGNGQRGGFHNATNQGGGSHTAWNGTPPNGVPYNDSAFWNHINTAALNMAGGWNGDGQYGSGQSSAPAGTIQASRGGWNGGGYHGGGQSYAYGGIAPIPRGGGLNVGRGNNKRKADWSSMNNDAKKMKLDQELDRIQDRATKKETEIAAKKMELDRGLDGIREKITRKGPVSFFSLPRELRQQIIRYAYEDTVPAAVPADLSTHEGRLHFRLWPKKWYLCFIASAPLTLSLAKVDDRMVDDVNFIMVKYALERQALQARWIEQYKGAVADGRFVGYALATDDWKDAESWFWKDHSSWSASFGDYEDSEDQGYSDPAPHGYNWSDS